MLSGRFQGFWLICETVKMILSSKNQKREMKFQVSRHLSCRLTRRAVTSTVPPWLTHASPKVRHFPLTAGREPPTALHLDHCGSVLDSVPSGAASHPTSNGDAVLRAVLIISPLFRSS